MPWLSMSEMQDWTLPTSTPGAGICEPARKTTMIIRTNSSFRRRSGVRNAFANAVSMPSSPSLRVQPVSPSPSRAPRQPNPAGTQPLLWERSGYGDGSAGGLDLLLGRGRERLGGHVDLHRDLALAEHLDRVAVADGPLGHELV